MRRCQIGEDGDVSRGLWERAGRAWEQKLSIDDDALSESGYDTVVSDLQNFVVETARLGAISLDS